MIEVVQDLLNVIAKNTINHLEGKIDLDQKIGIKIQLTTLNATKKSIVLNMLKKVKSIDIRTKVVAVIMMNIEAKRKVKSITVGLDLDDYNFVFFCLMNYPVFKQTKFFTVPNYYFYDETLNFKLTIMKMSS